MSRPRCAGCPFTARKSIHLLRTCNKVVICNVANLHTSKWKQPARSSCLSSLLTFKNTHIFVDEGLNLCGCVFLRVGVIVKLERKTRNKSSFFLHFSIGSPFSLSSRLYESYFRVLPNTRPYKINMCVRVCAFVWACVCERITLAALLFLSCHHSHR